MTWYMSAYAKVGGSRPCHYSKSSPRPLDVPVLRACLPSTLSIVEYLLELVIRFACCNLWVGEIERNHTSITRRQSCSTTMMDPRAQRQSILASPPTTSANGVA